MNSSTVNVASYLAKGCNVAIEAVPGAGKTHLIMKLCKDGVPSLILAYNRELADTITKTLDESESSSTMCLTFHGLCSRCLALTRDDHQLMKVVRQAENGELTPRDVPKVSRIFIDEAQDVRELYVRLLRVLGLTNVQIVVAGDRNQLVYDFDDEFPATLATLEFPKTTFGGFAWQHVTMNESHRITRQMCSFVNLLFNTNITSEKDGSKVEIRVPRNMYSNLYDTIKDILEDKDVLILVDYKNGNRALRTLLNTVSRSGKNVHVHGVSSGDNVNETTIKCGTFWSAKGLEANTVIVLLPGSSPFNPTYVAMTRARQRLIVVIDPRDPHPLVSRIALQNSSFVEIPTTPWSKRVLDDGVQIGNPDSVSFIKRPRKSPKLRCLDRFMPKQSIIDDMIGHTVTDIFTSDAMDIDYNIGTITIVMGLARAELLESGVVRAMQDIICPSRLEYEQTPDAIRLGVMSRIVPRFVSDDELLARDLRNVALRAYRDVSNINNLANVALGIMSWDSWDCTMRSMQPTKQWASTAEDGVNFITDTIPSGAIYDIRLMDHKKTCHVRVHAMTRETVYHFVWEVTSADIGQALVRAALHPRGCCFLVQVSNEEMFKIHVEKEDISTILAE